MNTSNHCHLSFDQRRLALIAGVLLSALAAAGLILSGLSALPALLLWLLVLAYSLWSLRVLLRWRGLSMQAPSGLTFFAADGGEHPGEYFQGRVWGPCLLLQADRAGSREQLLLWLPALPLNQRRQLMRCLARMSRLADSNV